MESTKDPNVDPSSSLQNAARCGKHRLIPVPIPDLYHMFMNVDLPV